MKKKAIIFILSVIFIQILIINFTQGQSTIVKDPFHSDEPFKTISESFKIMEKALEEQFEALNMNTDSLEYYLGLLEEHLENFPNPLPFPGDITKNFENNYNRNIFTTTLNLKGESKKEEIFEFFVICSLNFFYQDMNIFFRTNSF